MKSLQPQSGYTLVEVLVYIGVFISLSFVIVALILSVLLTNRQVLPLNALSRGAVSALESITKEIRGAVSVDVPNSLLATSTGSLRLDTFDSAGSPRTVDLYLNASMIKINQNGIYLGPLTSSEVTVTGLTFDLASATSTLVKIELDLTAGSGQYQKSEKFYSSVELRTDN